MDKWIIRTYPKKFNCVKAEFYDESHYDKIITESHTAYKENGDILFVFVKGSISYPNREKYINAIKSNAKTKTKNRGTASGVAVVNRLATLLGVDARAILIKSPVSLVVKLVGAQKIPIVIYYLKNYVKR